MPSASLILAMNFPPVLYLHPQVTVRRPNRPSVLMIPSYQDTIFINSHVMINGLAIDGSTSSLGEAFLIRPVSLFAPLTRRLILILFVNRRQISMALLPQPVTMGARPSDVYLNMWRRKGGATQGRDETLHRG